MLDEQVVPLKTRGSHHPRMNLSRIRSWMFLTVLTAAAWGDVAAAEGTMLRLLRILRDRGSITSEEFEELKAASEAESRVVVPAGLDAGGRGSAVEELKVPDAARASGTIPKAEVAEESRARQAVALPREKSKWYDRLGIRGYVQMRYHLMPGDPEVPLNVPADRSVSTTDSFLIRRGRLILSGDVSDRVFLYAQPDMNATPTDGQFSVQLRDLYADVAFDSGKEFRLRLGQSKVPFGFVNMQSSQNRTPLERADAFNSAVEGERDIGAFLYWAPSEIRERFRHLVASGLKGSGDYGVAGFGVYSGQGLNRSDRNGAVHMVGRLTYPWELPDGQFLEAGVQAYTGRFVVDTETIPDPQRSGGSVTPAVRADGVADERVGLSAIWYPQPFGIEAEWNVGRGPTLAGDGRRIESDFLHGGYVQLQYRMETTSGVMSPFVRWQRYSGGRKFGRNAPDSRLEEVDVGIEWSPFKELEIAITYTHTFRRTNTRVAPYADTTDAHRVGFQVQWNY